MEGGGKEVEMGGGGGRDTSDGFDLRKNDIVVEGEEVRAGAGGAEGDNTTDSSSSLTSSLPRWYQRFFFFPFLSLSRREGSIELSSLELRRCSRRGEGRGGGEEVGGGERVGREAAEEEEEGVVGECAGGEDDWRWSCCSLVKTSARRGGGEVAADGDVEGCDCAAFKAFFQPSMVTGVGRGDDCAIAEESECDRLVTHVACRWEQQGLMQVACRGGAAVVV